MKGGGVKYLLAALGVAVFGVWAWATYAGTEAQDGQSTRQQLATPIMGGIVSADTTVKTFRMTSDGYLRVAEASPNRDANLRFESIIDNLTTGGSLAYNAGDSSAVLDVHRLRHMKLLIKAVPKTSSADTSAVVRLAFQVRIHLNGQPASDTTATFAEYFGGLSTVGVSAAAGADSNVYGHIFTGGRGSTGGLPWSGEFVVQIQAKRSAHGNSIAVNGHDWYYPSGIALSLDNLAGRDFWADYISVRVRNLTNTPCAVLVHLIGTPL